jgi:hypothetical protein
MMRKVLRRATKKYSAEDLPFSLTKLSFSLARSLLSQPRNLVASVTPFFSNAFMNRLSRPSATFRSSSSNRISNSFFRNPPHLRAFEVKMSTSKQAEVSQPVANGVYKPRYIDVRFSLATPHSAISRVYPSSQNQSSGHQWLTQALLVDRHQPHRPRLQRHLPRHPTPPQRPPRCPRPREISRLLEDDRNGE